MDGTPARAVFVYLPNGVHMPDWQIRSAGADYTLTEPLRSLGRHRPRITPISGLHHPGAMGQNHRCEKTWLTGADLSPEDDRFRSGISADQVLAQTLGAATRHASLELSITGGSLAWTRAGVALPSERRPRAIFDRLCGADSGGAESSRERLGRRRSVLDAVLGEARGLRSSIGKDDRSRLDDYLDAVRDLEGRVARAEDWLSVPKPEVDEATARRLRRDIDPRDAGDYYRTIYDLIALALRTDQTRVLTLMLGTENHGLALPEIGVRQTRHELSHHNGVAEQIRRLSRSDAFHVELLAGFLDQLETHDEQGEPLVDRTVVLFGSGMSYGHSHGNANLPTILAGGGALGLKHGRHLDHNLPTIGRYPEDDDRAHYALCLRPTDPDARLSNLLLTVLQVMGVDRESFSDSLGPIDALLT